MDASRLDLVVASVARVAALNTANKEENRVGPRVLRHRVPKWCRSTTPC